jgi:hypothetical protein
VTLERFVTQFDGCTYVSGGLSCTCAVEAMWLFRASQGKIVTTSCAVRRETHDTVGGTNLRQAEAVSKLHGIANGMVYQPTDVARIFDLVETGRYGSHFQLSYAPFVGTPYDRFGGRFRGGHDVYLSRRGSAAGTLRVGDPGAKGFADIPKTLLALAAGRLDFGGGVTLNDEAGGGKAYAYVTPADPATPETLYHWFIQAKTPRTVVWNAPNGTKYGALSTGSGSCRKTHVDGRLWLQIVKPGSPIHGKWLHAGPTTRITPI